MRTYIIILLLTFGSALGSMAQSSRTSAFGTVDFSKYNDNMTLVCVVKQGGSAVLDCELAVFDENEELRGKAFSHSDNGMIFLTIQGEGSGMKLHFKASLNGESVADISETMTFSAGQTPGSFESPQVLTLMNLKGDINNDGTVNICDLAQLISLMLQKQHDDKADMDGNGKLDMNDVNAMRQLILNK